MAAPCHGQKRRGDAGVTKLVGILNVTPDSFSDGGAHAVPEDAVARYQALLEAGADIVDIGAESTRPGAVPLTSEEEWARLGPVLQSVLPGKVPVSVDTRHAQTAERALAAGVSIINDVTGLRDDAMLGVLANHDCPVVVMHARSVPVVRGEQWADGTDEVAAILHWKQEITERAQKAGIAAERLIYDPGIGFGKSREQSFALVRRADELVASGGQWYVGHSRKSFLTLFTDAAPEARDGWTLAFSRLLARAGVHYLRVHHVAMHREAEFE